MSTKKVSHQLLILLLKTNDRISKLQVFLRHNIFIGLVKPSRNISISYLITTNIIIRYNNVKETFSHIAFVVRFTYLVCLLSSQGGGHPHIDNANYWSEIWKGPQKDSCFVGETPIVYIPKGLPCP